VSRAKSDFETAEFYGAVYDILVEHGGAGEWQRDSFVREFLGDDPTHEWRFQGHLGFGGKFWRNDGRIYVSCYPEDRTPKLGKLVEKLNGLLNELVQRFISKGPAA